MGSTALFEKYKNELANDVQKLASLVVLLLDSTEGVLLMNGARSSLASEVKEK